MKTKRSRWFATHRSRPAQSTVEYLLLLGLMVVVLVVGFRELVPRTRDQLNVIYLNTMRNIVGEVPDTRVNGVYP